MIRRFVNVVAENYRSGGLYSLHRLDVSKHLFYTSTAEAEAATAAPELSTLPAASARFQRSPTAVTGSTNLMLFTLMSPGSSEGRILCCNQEGHSLVYDADGKFSSNALTLQGPMGVGPIAFSVGGAADGGEEDLYVINSAPSPHGGGSCFYALGLGGWEPLPQPPFYGMIRSHALLNGGRTICISSHPDGFGTYCFDTVAREWWLAGDWVLPFQGRVEFVPGQHLWLGFNPDRPNNLRATSDLAALEEERTMDEEPRLQDAPPDCHTSDNWWPLRLNLLPLGGSRFCLAKVFRPFEDTYGETTSPSTT